MLSLNATGIVASEPVRRETKNGMVVTNFRFLSTKRKGDQEVTTFLSIAIWGKAAEYAATFAKGDLLHLCGDFSMGEFVDRDGATKASLDLNVDALQMLRKNKGEASQSPQSSAPPKARTKTSPRADDDIPF